MYKLISAESSFDNITYSRPHRRQFYWLFLWIPFVTGITWFMTLFTLLYVWISTGSPQYITMPPTQHIFMLDFVIYYMVTDFLLSVYEI